MNDLEQARREVSQSSAGGAAFLVSFGATILAVAIASFLVEYLLVSGLAALLAVWLGVAGAWAFVTIVLDFDFSADWRRLSRSASSSLTGGLEDRTSIRPCQN